MPPPPPGCVAAVEEAHVLLERMAGHCRSAAIALAEGNLDALDAALAAREPLAHRVGELVRCVIQERERLLAAGVETGAVEKLLSRLERAAEALREADGRLRLAVGSELLQIRRELERMESEKTVLAAYGQAPGRESRTIDCFR